MKKVNNLSKIHVVLSNDIKSIRPKEKLSLMINSTSAETSYLERLIQILSDKDYFKNIKIFDMNYGQRALKSIRNIGNDRYFDGLYMLSSQAAESFRLWTNIDVNPIDIYNDLSRELKKDMK
jgi:shikimate 5-dehydrogenase